MPSAFARWRYSPSPPRHPAHAPGDPALPALEARAAFVPGAPEQNMVLDAMGEKYHSEWFRWGPRFRNGLADGSRVMLRYSPT